MCFTREHSSDCSRGNFQGEHGWEVCSLDLDFLQKEECQQPNLRAFPGAEFSDGSPSPSNLTQKPLTTWERWQFQVGVLSVRDEHNAEMGDEEGGRDFPWVPEGNKPGTGVRDPSVDSPSGSKPGPAIPLWASSPHSERLTRSLPVLLLIYISNWPHWEK